MGVSGTGKSTVGHALALRLGRRFVDGDDFHSPANRAKMSAGVALDDLDRAPWLAAVRDWMTAQHRAGVRTVVACSALRRAYRDVLRDAAGSVFFAHLTVATRDIESRLLGRDHFMPAALLGSQLAALEPLTADEPGAVIDASGAVAHTVQQVAALPALG